MDGVEQEGVRDNRKRKKTLARKERSKKQAASSVGVPPPSVLPAVEIDGVGISERKPSLTSAAEGNLLPVAGAIVAVEERSKTSSRRSARRSARREKRSKRKTSKTSTLSSSSSASSQRSKKEAITDSTRTMTPHLLESEQANDQIRLNISHEKVGVDGRSEDKPPEAISATTNVGSSWNTQACGTLSGTEAQLSATPGVLQMFGEVIRPEPDKTIASSTSGSPPTCTEQRGSSCVLPTDASAGRNADSCHALSDYSAVPSVGVTTGADNQGKTQVDTAHDSKTTDERVATRANSEERRVSVGAAPTTKKAVVLSHPQGEAQTTKCEDKIEADPLIQPTSSATSSQGHPLSSDQLGTSGGRETYLKSESASDTKRVGGVGSDAQADDAQRKTRLGSSSYWSFYPLNVTFVTEMNSHEARVLLAAVVAFIAVTSSLLIAAVVLLLYANRIVSPLACVTAECMAARDYLAGLLNKSKDACSDFYGYVCDSWLARGPDGGSFHEDSVAASLARINESLWNHKIDVDDTEDMRLVLGVYRECYRYVSERSTTSSFKRTLQTARKQLNWSKMVGCRDYRELLTVLVQTSLLVGFHTVMVLEVLSHEGRAVMRLSRGKSLHQKIMSLHDQGGNLQAIFRRLLDYEAKHLPKILEFDAIVQRDLYTGDFPKTQLGDEIRGLLEEFIDDLLPGTKETDWMVAVNDVLTPLGMYTVRHSDLALASGIDRIRMVFKNIAAQGGIRDVSLYLASHLDAEVLRLELSGRRASSDRMKTAGFCLELVQRSHAFLWPELAARLLKLRGSSEVLQTLHSQLQGSFKESAMFTWIHKMMRPYVEEEVQKVQLMVVSEAVWPKGAWIDMKYSPPVDVGALMDSDANFVELFLKVLSVAHKKRLRNPPTIARFIISRLEPRSELAYSSEIHSVVVPTVYQSPPYLYPTGVPSYFNYGTIGALLASSIADAVGPALSSLAETTRRQLGDIWWVPEMSSHYNETSRCLNRLINRLGLQRHQSGAVDQQGRDMFLRVQGLRLAYDGLVASFGIATTTHGFRQLWAEAQAAFFARFCLLSCDANETPRPLQPRANCLVPLHNMPEFGAVFGCTTREDFAAYTCLQ